MVLGGWGVKKWRRESNAVTESRKGRKGNVKNGKARNGKCERLEHGREALRFQILRFYIFGCDFRREKLNLFLRRKI